MTVGTSPLGTLMDYEAPKKWYKANANAILQIFGPSDHIQLEDLFLGIRPHNWVLILPADFLIVIDNCGAFEDTADPPQQVVLSPPCISTFRNETIHSPTMAPTQILPLVLPALGARSITTQTLWGVDALHILDPSLKSLSLTNNVP